MDFVIRIDSWIKSQNQRIKRGSQQVPNRNWHKDINPEGVRNRRVLRVEAKWKIELYVKWWLEQQCLTFLLDLCSNDTMLLRTVTDKFISIHELGKVPPYGWTSKRWNQMKISRGGLREIPETSSTFEGCWRKEWTTEQAGSMSQGNHKGNNCAVGPSANIPKRVGWQLGWRTRWVEETGKTQLHSLCLK